MTSSPEPNIQFTVSEPGVPRVCLNMIVKNESKIILRLLESVSPIIDGYVVCDTGSTDNTVELIRDFFAERQIPGQVITEPFRDFGYNRSFALAACDEQSDCDYVLLLDADMVFWLNPAITAQEFKRGLTGDAYHMFQGTDAFFYKNTRIVRRGIGAKYWGVTHEYVSTPDGTKYVQIEKARAFVQDIGDGGAKADKFERDIRLLKTGLEENPGSERYTFYLGNSYRDNGDTDLAIETYKRRAAMGGWFEEVWYSMFNIGVCYKSKGDMQSAVHWWMEAYQYFPKRVENLYEIITHYRHEGKNQLAYLFYSMALKQVLANPNPDYLFLKKDVYEYKLDYEFSVFGYYCNVDGYDMTRICVKVMNCALADAATFRNVMSNYKFYAKSLAAMRETQNPALVAALSQIGRKFGLHDDPLFKSSTPSLALIDGGSKLAVCVRFVNYRINERGGYDNQAKIESENVIAIIDPATGEVESEQLMRYDESKDNVYVGLEDVRLHWDAKRNRLLYNANRGLGANNIVVEHGVVQLDSAAGLESGDDMSPLNYKFARMFKESQQNAVEKNWVLFEDAEGNTKVIYGWHNLSIGDFVENSGDNSGDNSADEYLFKQTHSISTPNLFRHVRGSTNGVRVGQENWFICHVVSYEDRRYYYHMFVALDATTHAVRKYSPPFTFDGEKVEYTLGFFYRRENNTFNIGYSKMDRSTHYMAVKKSTIEGLCVGMV